MTALRKPELLTFEQYLDAEASAPTRHEFLAGEVHAMAGATAAHNQLALNCAGMFLTHLKGRPCRPFMSDMKLKIRYDESDSVYYPDVMVDCAGLAPAALFTTSPTVLVEVLSHSTERIDRREKWWIYRTIETLQEYVLIDQQKAEVTIFRRSASWVEEVLGSKESVIDLPSLGFRCTVADIYADVQLPGEKPLAFV